MKEFTEDQIAKAIKNPYFDRLCRKIEVTVRHDDYELFEKLAEAYDVTPERIMQSALYKYAKLMREED